MPWATGERCRAGRSEAPAKVATAHRPAAGNYKLQVAAVRSREEAEKLRADRCTASSRCDGAVAAEIDEAVIGSMGTFYRVGLGPMPMRQEPGQLCKTLKPQGFDCMVVTQ